MKISASIATSKELANWIAHEINDVQLRSGVRLHVGGTLLAVALDHHQAIIDLVEKRHFSSAAALVRPLFDAYLRGVWVAHGATETQLRKFVNGGRPVSIDAMISALEQHPAFADGTLRRVKDATWSILCDFTHGGVRLIGRNMKDRTIEINFLDEEVLEILAAADSWALLAAVGIAGLADDDAQCLRILARAKQVGATRASQTIDNAKNRDLGETR